MKKIKEDMEKSKYTSFDSLKYMFKNVWNFDKKTSLFYFLNIPAKILLPIVTGLVVKIMMDAVTNQISEWLLVGLIAGVTFIIGFLTWLEPILYEKGVAVSVNQMVHYKIKSFKKLMTLDYQFLESTDARRKFEKCKLFLESHRAQYFLYYVVEALGCLFGIISYIFIVGSVNPLLIILMFVCCVIMFVAQNLLLKIQKKNDSKSDEIDLKNNYIFRTATDISAAKDIRLYSFDNLLNDSMADIKTRSKKVVKSYTSSDFKFIALKAVMTLLTESLAFFLLLKDVLAEKITVSDFVFLFGIATGFWLWLARTVWCYHTLKRQALICGYYREFLDYEEEKNDKIEFEGEIKEIEFDNVSFTYDGKTSPTIKNMTFIVKAGEKIAIVGKNGVGKTTGIKLLTALYRPGSGKVLFNGENGEKYSKDSLYSHFSAVFQDHLVLPMSIKDNIVFGCAYEEEKFKHIIELSGLKDKLASLEKGAETLMIKKLHETAVDFSGGEMQRLLLARALYKGSEVLVLDEPTAALDPIAENNMYLQYNELAKNKICFFISHRLSSTRFCDKILFISDGEIKESGTHEELLEMGGEYAEMFAVQSFYYRQGNNFNSNCDSSEAQV